ncbi:MAG: hypothetical protein Q9M89_09750 [Persephonella sp.]|nr:hypothetical protein [Persephonella sp.]
MIGRAIVTAVLIVTVSGVCSEDLGYQIYKNSCAQCHGEKQQR